ncbi:hypothetical protein CRE_16326 [Caenorhabditis remanei]|uniref:Uncharacterized protein n=1 Tax=Caenorhabditis remanei TaxID=31234 RepID=E3N811_CAERE|nr:hypothetical protein CRE_16326 [Caenorhabditis remanei]
MAKLMNTKSAPSAPANICLFDTPPSQVAFSKGRWMTYTPSNAVDSKGPYTFNVFDSAHFFQLNRTYVSFKLRLKNVEANGTGEPVKIIHTNFSGATFFNQIKLSFNNVQVYDSSYYNFKSYILTLLGENSDTKDGYLTAAGWQDHEDDDQRALTDKNHLDLCAPLLLEPFQTERLLVPHINIQLTLYRSSDTFCMQSTKDTKAELEITDLKLHMQGRLELPFSTLYHDIIPRRIIVGLLDPETVVTKDSLKFDHFNLSDIQIDAGGTMYPAQPIHCDFENKNYAEAFARFYEELGGVSDGCNPRISYKMYREGFTFFVFNLSAIDSSNAWELVKSGSTQLFLRFAKKTPTGGLNVLVLSQFDGMFEIDRFRNSVDINLATYLVLKFGKHNHLSASEIREMNRHLRQMDVPLVWNGCNGLPVDLTCELSLDSTPRNHSFVKLVTRPGKGPKHQFVTVLSYFEKKYGITLNYSHSPLVRDNGGRMYPTEAIWIRIHIS